MPQHSILDRGDSVIGVAGDWHGKHSWAEKILRRFHEVGVSTVYQLGDFGIFPRAGRDWYLERVDNICHQLDINIFVTPGNRESWRHIDQTHAVDEGTEPQQILPGTSGTQRLFLLPRGYRWTHAGRTFISLGGSASVDKHLRTEGVDWFPGELIPEVVAEKVAAAGHAEIMLAHDVPNLDIPIIQGIIATNRGNWPVSSLARAAQNRQRLDLAYAGVQPLLYLHGHYHQQGDFLLPDGTRVLSLGMDQSPSNILTLDLKAKNFGVGWTLLGEPGPPVLQKVPLSGNGF